MRLKNTLFDDSNLPFQLAYGQVGLINLKIPFWDMFKSPLVIEIEDIFGLVNFNPIENWNTEDQQNKFRAYT